MVCHSGDFSKDTSLIVAQALSHSQKNGLREERGMSNFLRIVCVPTRQSEERCCPFHGCQRTNELLKEQEKRFQAIEVEEPRYSFIRAFDSPDSTVSEQHQAGLIIR